jgi:thymidylate synthase (FAD)
MQSGNPEAGQPHVGEQEEGEGREVAPGGMTAEQSAEIADLRDTAHTTRRATVPALEDILYEPIPVLDQGFVRVIDYLGDDGAVVQAARVSYGKGTKTVNTDRGLIRYLMRHRHTTPFEMCEIKVHVKLPIFVARQWIRHRTANVNEYSARYSILDHEFYVPDRAYLDSRREERHVERLIQAQSASQEPDLFGLQDLRSTVPPAPARHELAPQSASNRQGREGDIPDAEAEEILREIKAEGNRAYTIYTKLLNETQSGEILDEERTGLARELARMVLPTNYFTQWYWKVDLHNLLHFLSLRADPHAQYEIRAYADVLCDIVAKWVPATWEAFEDYQLTKATFSGPALGVLRELVDQGLLQDEAKCAELREKSGMSAREFREFLETLRKER